MAKTFDMTPEQAYTLTLAALELVASVSPNTYKRIRPQGAMAARPGVGPQALVRLVNVLNEIRPGMADDAIARAYNG